MWVKNLFKILKEDVVIPRTLFEGNSTISGQVKVVESLGVRRLLVDGLTQSISIDRLDKTGGYWDSIVQLAVSRLKLKDKILVLGLGGGTLPKLFTRNLGPIKIDTVEIDPLIVDLAKKYFNLVEDNIKIYTGDAANFLNSLGEKYNFICVDTYIGDKIPESVQTNKFFDNLFGRLEENGTIVLNRIFHQTETKELSDFIKLLKNWYSRVYYIKHPGYFRSDNVIVWCQS